MGDRANIVVYFGKSEIANRDHQVCFYSHWDGNCLAGKLHEALLLAKENNRLKHGAYLARIIFCRMLGDDHGVNLKTTSYGICPDIEDNERPILLVNIPEQKVSLLNEMDQPPMVTWSFNEYLDETPEGLIELVENLS